MSPFTGQYTDNVLETGGLTEGQDYYIMVHPANPSYDGNFQVCISEQVSYDYIEGAIDLTAFVDSNGYWSSLDSGIVFSNVGATPDGDSTSCGGAPGANVWFKYETDSTLGILEFNALTGGSQGTLAGMVLTAWIDTAGNLDLTEIICATDTSQGGGVSLSGLPLLPHMTYYFSIQSQSVLDAGIFNIEIQTGSYEFHIPNYLVSRDYPAGYDPSDYYFFDFPQDSTIYRVIGEDPVECYFDHPCEADENGYGIFNPYFSGPNCLPPEIKDPFGNWIGFLGKYGSDPRQVYHIYSTANVSENPKVVVMIHGGGWAMGPNLDYAYGWPFQYSNDNCDAAPNCNSLVKDLLADGHVVIALFYRLTKYFNNGENPSTAVTWQEQIDDIDAGIEHIRANLYDCLGYGADDIHIIGESAGGMLSLLYAYNESSPTFLKSVTSLYAPTNMQRYGQFAKLRKPFSYLSDDHILEWPFSVDYSCESNYFPQNTPATNWYFPFNIPMLLNSLYSLIYTNINICVPAIANMEELDVIFEVENSHGVVDGDWRIFELYNFIQAGAGSLITIPVTDQTLLAYSPFHALSYGLAIPTFIMHGTKDNLVPYLKATEGMRSSLFNNGGLILDDVCNPQNLKSIEEATQSTISSYNELHVLRKYINATHGLNTESNALLNVAREDIRIWISAN